MAELRDLKATVPEGKLVRVLAAEAKLIGTPEFPGARAIVCPTTPPPKGTDDETTEPGILTEIL